MDSVSRISELQVMRLNAYLFLDGEESRKTLEIAPFGTRHHVCHKWYVRQEWLLKFIVFAVTILLGVFALACSRSAL